MCAQRSLILALILPLLAACDDLPTDSASGGGPLFAAVAAPRFIEGDGSVPDIDGNMVTTFKLAGLGSNGSNTVTASAEASALWACQTAIGEFDVYPAPLVSEAPVSRSTALTGQSGQVTGSIVLNPAASSLQCLAPNHKLVPVTATFWNVQLSYPDAATFSVPGIFDVQNYFIRFEVVPSITNVALALNTLVIGGAPVDYTVTINNPLATLSNVVVQAYFRQGTTYRAAGGTVVICPDVTGTLPSGDCTFAFITQASNDPGVTGNGDLVAGPAVFEIQLEIGTSLRVLAGFPVNVVLSTS
jgi:hypothetical protein